MQNESPHGLGPNVGPTSVMWGDLKLTSRQCCSGVVRVNVDFNVVTKSVNQVTVTWS